MNAPPRELDGARLLCFAEVTTAVRPTGKTTHRVDEEVLGPARGLAICQYAGDTNFYLFYCDSDWTVVTDTCHRTLEDARHQAACEYDGISKYWTNPT